MPASYTSTQGLLWGTDDYFPALRLLLSTITYSPRSQQLTCLFFFRRLGRGPTIRTSGSGLSSRAADPSRFIGSDEHRSCHKRKGTRTLLWWKQKRTKKLNIPRGSPSDPTSDHSDLINGLLPCLLLPTCSALLYSTHLSAFYNLLLIFCFHSVSFFPQIFFVFLFLLSNFYESTWK